MKIENVQCESFKITDAPALDPVTVILLDYGNGRGKLIIECYGSAWSGYWGAMGGSLWSFVSRCDEEYLCGAMSPSDRKMKKVEQNYLLRIMKAVKEAIGEQGKEGGE